MDKKYVPIVISGVIVCLAVALLVTGVKSRNPETQDKPEIFEEACYTEGAPFVWIKTDGVFLLSRTNFGKAFRMIVIPKGSVISAVEDCGRYLRVSVGQGFLVYGYVLKCDVFLPEEGAKPFYPTEYVTVSPQRACLWKTPEDFSEAVAVVYRGDVLEFYGVLSEMCLVRKGDLFGYIDSAFIR